MYVFTRIRYVNKGDIYLCNNIVINQTSELTSSEESKGLVIGGLSRAFSLNLLLLLVLLVLLLLL